MHKYNVVIILIIDYKCIVVATFAPNLNPIIVILSEKIESEALRFGVALTISIFKGEGIQVRGYGVSMGVLVYEFEYGVFHGVRDVSSNSLLQVGIIWFLLVGWG